MISSRDDAVLEFSIPAAWLVNTGLLLARMTALTLFVPLPGATRVFSAPKIVLALALTALMSPLATVGPGPELLRSPAATWGLTPHVLAEAALGASLGLCYRLALEAFGLASQIFGFQAGYSYVNMVDPSSEVDSSILTVLLTLLGGLLFFAFELDLFVVKTLADSLSAWPLGGFRPRGGAAEAMIRLGSMMLTSAARLALPVVAVLLLIDVSLGLLNQAHSRMQLLTLSFPAKIIATTVILHPVLNAAPRLFYELAERASELATALIAR